jgi:hypothetical protein
MDCQLCQRMRDLLTKQDPNPPKKGPSISNNHHPRNTPIPAGGNGPDNGPSQIPREGCNPHDCRPQVLPSGGVCPLQHKHHWSRHRPAVPGTHIQMVRNTHQNNHRSRPTVYLSFWASPHPKTRSQTKPVVRIPPPNRRDIEKEEPIGRTIPAPSNFDGP